MTKIRPPSDLIAEIINFLPLNIRWANLRISFIFDIYLFEKQGKCIIVFKKFFASLANGIVVLNLVVARLNRRVRDQLRFINGHLNFILAIHNLLHFRVLG
ncbi:hypothetical protein ACQ4LE_007536 [Meloidogyne hapla]